MGGRLLSRRSPALRVTVYSAKNLPPADVNGKADPYCTMQLVGAVGTERLERSGRMEPGGKVQLSTLYSCKYYKHY